VKALTVTQPWATLIAIGAKRIETRNWCTPYRGPLAIHAAKGFPRWAREICNEPEFARELGPDPLPLGVVVATCRLVSIESTAMLQYNSIVDFEEYGRFYIDDRERHFGDYSSGRSAWLLADVKRVEEPIPARGYLQLWEWNEEGIILRP
jgi:activating signal cointegrator 1